MRVLGTVLGAIAVFFLVLFFLVWKIWPFLLALVLLAIFRDQIAAGVRWLTGAPPPA